MPRNTRHACVDCVFMERPSSMDSKCAASLRIRKNWVTGVEATILEYCSEKNTDGWCKDFKARPRSEEND